MDKFSFLGSVHGAFVEEVYEEYLEDPDSVLPTWQSFFQGYQFGFESYTQETPEPFHKEFKVINLINGYRERGHLFTKTNPVRERRSYSPTLDIENFGLDSSDLQEVFQAGSEVGIGPATLEDILTHLNEVYCQHVGVEYMHIQSVGEVNWLKSRLQQNNNSASFSIEQKKRILKKLNEAQAFENYLQTKYVGQKRFSLEGGEATIPALDLLIEKSAREGVREFVFGMAHRGRLNVLANIFKKEYKKVFKEFEGKGYLDEEFDGDVKYHLGYYRSYTTKGGHDVELNLCPNPSHLETVNPVVQGIAKSKIKETHGGDPSKIMPILIHGDAAIAAQGIVYEVVQMAQLDPYHVGGTLHLVINNQIGFTTNYRDARTSIYCTDVAKTTMCPIFHVNGDDVEAVAHVMEVAAEYRQRFRKDVFIDLLCYRKYGHNEGDEPRFTQPKLYSLISKHPSPREIYINELLKEGVVYEGMVNELEAAYKELLDKDLSLAKLEEKTDIIPFLQKEWKDYRAGTLEDFEYAMQTGVEHEKLVDIAQRFCTIPEELKVYKKAERIYRDRLKMVDEGENIDWGMAEMWAYATLLDEGISVRMTGQDVERGTFAHRHAVLRTEELEHRYTTLSPVCQGENTTIEIRNSLLSEYGVMGFEYGYAMANPDTLTIWEAQFGDFSNGAQILIDQYLSSAEDKWKSQNGLVLLLPHGYEGQGAEHSSARLERYLQLCAQSNMQVCYPTTPAQMFHLLRRQQKRRFRKPLVVMTPKSLLRLPKCVSSLGDFTTGRFHELYDDASSHPSKIQRIIFCSGKIFYELMAKKEAENREDVAIIRLEQLYPLPLKEINTVITKYSKATRLLWVQEEPENMGAWTFILSQLRHFPFELVSRSASAAPASGSSLRAKRRQEEIITKAFE